MHIFGNPMLLTGEPGSFNKYSHFLIGFGILLCLVKFGMMALSFYYQDDRCQLLNILCRKYKPL